MNDKRIDESLWFEHEMGHLLFPWYRRSSHHGRSAYWVSDGSNRMEDAEPVDTMEELVAHVFQRRRSVWLRAKGTPALQGLYRLGERTIKNWGANPSLKALAESVGGIGAQVSAARNDSDWKFSSQEFRKALRAAGLTELQLGWLVAHAKRDGGRATMRQLSADVGQADWETANLHYGKVAGIIGAHLARAAQTRVPSPTQNMEWIARFLGKGEDGEAVWQMLPGLREALGLAGGTAEAQAPVTEVQEPMGAEIRNRIPCVWRLIAHHESPHEAMEEMIAGNAMAVGWNDIGDLDVMRPESSAQITKAIRDAYAHLQNTGPGGASLWRLYRQVVPGDLVIVSSASSRAFVLEVVGDYFFAPVERSIRGYRHQRAAILTNIDPDELWSAHNGQVAPGENVRWTLVRCSDSVETSPPVYDEGRRFEITSTAIERNPRARQACLDFHGYSCHVCGFNFEATYGEIGKGYIHVHHRVDISFRKHSHQVDPVLDLIPLCPNCHAMAHSSRPAIATEDLKKLLMS